MAQIVVNKNYFTTARAITRNAIDVVLLEEPSLTRASRMCSPVVDICALLSFTFPHQFSRRENRLKPFNHEVINKPRSNRKSVPLKRSGGGGGTALPYTYQRWGAVYCDTGFRVRRQDLMGQHFLTHFLATVGARKGLRFQICNVKRFYYE